jgi:hypothetical protein
MKFKPLILASTIMLSIAACTQKTIDQQAEAEKLMELYKSWAK